MIQTAVAMKMIPEIKVNEEAGYVVVDAPPLVIAPPVSEELSSEAGILLVSQLIEQLGPLGYLSS